MSCKCRCKQTPRESILKAYIDMLDYYGLTQYYFGEDGYSSIWDTLPQFADPSISYRDMYHLWHNWYMQYWYYMYMYSYACHHHHPHHHPYMGVDLDA